MADTDSSENSGPKKGLWALMGQQPRPGKSKPTDDSTSDSASKSTEPASVAGPAAENVATTEVVPESAGVEESPRKTGPQGRPKGLWSVMAHGERPQEVETPKAPQPDDEMRQAFAAPIAPVKGADRRLRQLQRVEIPQDEEPVEGSESLADANDSLSSSRAVTQSEPLELEALNDEPKLVRPDVKVVSPPRVAEHREVAGQVRSLNVPSIVATPGPANAGSSGARSARNCLIWGIVSVPLSFLTIIPEIWTRIPSSICGFVALLTGFLAVTEIQRSHGKRSHGKVKGTVAAYTGIALGLWGMFSGPYVFGPADLYGQISDWHTGSHLQQLSQAVEAYYQVDHVFPPGGVFHVPKPGVTDPVHGWMAHLLPHLPDGAPLAAQVDYGKPYFDPVNLPVMEQLIPSFLAAGGSRSLVQGKYGPAHFSGLGGVLTLDDGTVANVGVFDINSDVTRDDITDGLSHTILMGEIGVDYPAWGEPRNWRQIGKGLNREINGFGNARHTGAMFLMADGSVKFFPNKTDVKVLQSLSTRDGEDEGKF